MPSFSHRTASHPRAMFGSRHHQTLLSALGFTALARGHTQVSETLSLCTLLGRIRRNCSVFTGPTRPMTQGTQTPTKSAPPVPREARCKRQPQKATYTLNFSTHGKTNLIRSTPTSDVTPTLLLEGQNAT